MLRIFLFLLPFLFLSTSGYAQFSSENMQARNGKTLPAHGTLRVLLIFAEVEFDTNPGNDPTGHGQGTEHWPAGKLPAWKNEVFDAQPSEFPKGKLTRFYDECSFGELKILGDYADQIVTIKESETKSGYSYLGYTAAIREKLNSGTFKSANNLSEADFDMMTLTSYGQEKKVPENPEKGNWDHVMVILRNIPIWADQAGIAAQGNMGELFGKGTDSYSVFRGSNSLPFNISRHEFGHLIIGDNNFHVGGSQHASGGQNYFIPFQGGWGLIGAANSSLLTCNAWDRARLEWKPKNKSLYISCLNNQAEEVNADLDGENMSSPMSYVLRDFVTSGDALRIKLPGLDDAYPQWIWVENHQTSARNKSPFDNFQYSDNDCIDQASAGLYMYLQVDKEKKTGRDIYGGYGDYLRPIPANGFYDLIVEKDSVKNNCINSGLYPPYEKRAENRNPLTGNQEQELPAFDVNGDGFIGSKEFLNPAIERVDGELKRNLPYLGSSQHAFRKDGNKYLGIGSNPSLTPMYTYVSDNDSRRGGAFGVDGKGLPNNRRIYLHGLSIEILDEKQDGSIEILVRNDDHTLREDQRWCADSIVVPTMLILSAEKTLTLDRGKTPTRIIKATDYKNEKLFTDPTRLFLTENSMFHMEQNSKLEIQNGSSMMVYSTAQLKMQKGSEISIEKNSKLDLVPGAQIILYKKCQIKIKSGGKLVFSKGSIINQSGKRIKIKGATIIN